MIEARVLDWSDRCWKVFINHAVRKCPCSCTKSARGSSSRLLMSFYHRGDPDKTDYFGNTCLHLAAARGHEFCVKFLVKFGCNIWSLDIDRHSARELAAINSCERILQFLDLAQADQELNNRKKSRLLREKAEKDAEKRCSCVDRFFFASDFLVARERRNVGMISLHLS